VFFILVYSDFYEFPLPALRFEKTEEIDKKWKNDTGERNDAFLHNTPKITTSETRTTLTAKLTVHCKDLRIENAERTTLKKEQHFQHRKRHSEINVKTVLSKMADRKMT